MLQLSILSGRKAGVSWVSRRFPVRIGRALGADLRFEEDGVWDEHLKIDLQGTEGFLLSTQGDALASVNGQPVRQTLLRNGDTIEIGSLQFQFWLAQTRQTGLRLREALTWIGIAAISLSQIALIYWLLR